MHYHKSSKISDIDFQFKNNHASHNFMHENYSVEMIFYSRKNIFIDLLLNFHIFISLQRPSVSLKLFKFLNIYKSSKTSDVDFQVTKNMIFMILDMEISVSKIFNIFLRHWFFPTSHLNSTSLSHFNSPPYLINLLNSYMFTNYQRPQMLIFRSQKVMFSIILGMKIFGSKFLVMFFLNWFFYRPFNEISHLYITSTAFLSLKPL